MPAYGAAPPPMYWQPPRSETDPGQDLPWYGIGFLPAYARFWKKYATFSGRASRGEYWWAYLANSIVIIVLYVVAMVVVTTTQTTCTEYQIQQYQCTSDLSPAGVGSLVILLGYCLAAIIPNLAVTWRRLHDTGRSGAYYLISVIPYVGELILVILLAGKPSPDGVRYDVVLRGPYGAEPYGSPPGHDQPPPYEAYPR
ncbi:MAG: DUF805 domain-containing protein [Micrococcales bacterium]|nr:DUF805 domain-containing protein [Micrococcales bacterium]MCL2668876.1 DUF805 domain-containing protein [Micrococcales bacterium]